VENVTRQWPHTIAILGPNTLAEHVLSHLLEGEGYAVRLLKAPKNSAPKALPEGGSLKERLDGVEAVLLWPGPSLKEAAREDFVTSMRNTPATAQIPLLTLPSSLEIALQDEMAGEVPLAQLFAQLERVLEAVLASPAGSVDLVDLSDYGSPMGEPTEENDAVSYPPTSSGGATIREIGLHREPRLPPGYDLDLSDPEVLILCDADGSVVARFSARGATLETIEEEAWRAHRQSSQSA
jgi:hypothetical protein